MTHNGPSEGLGAHRARPRAHAPRRRDTEFDERLHARLAAVTLGFTFRSLGELTGHHPETVRRYMRGHTPSVEFIGALCEKLELNAHWVLTGQGAPRKAMRIPHALQNAAPRALCEALARWMSSRALRSPRLVADAELRSA